MKISRILSGIKSDVNYVIGMAAMMVRNMVKDFKEKIKDKKKK